MKVKSFQLHKRSSSEFDFIEDKFAIDPLNFLFTISDGATQGFKSNLWAELLTKRFINSPSFKAEELIQDFKDEAFEFNKLEHELSPNLAIRALQLKKIEFGGFATFLGAKIEDKKLHYISSGDVCLFILRNGKPHPFPFKNIEELDSDKGFLGTFKLLNNDVLSNQFFSDEINLEDSDKIFLATDAIARLILRQNSVLNELDELRDFNSFKDYILSKWNEKVLEEDDITIVKIENPLSPDIECMEFLPPPDFSLPKEPIIIFSQSEISNKLSPEEIKEIQNQLQQLNNNLTKSESKIRQLSKNVNLLKYLLIALLLGVFLIVMLFFWKINKTGGEKNNEIRNSDNSEKVEKKILKENKIPTTQ